MTTTSNPTSGASEHPAPNANDEQVFTGLASLSLADYDRCREAEARKVGLRVGTLDVEVARRRTTTGTGQGTVVDLPTTEPWPELVDGAMLLSAVADTFACYVALRSDAAGALALWVSASRLRLYPEISGIDFG